MKQLSLQVSKEWAFVGMSLCGLHVLGGFVRLARAGVSMGWGSAGAQMGCSGEMTVARVGEAGGCGVCWAGVPCWDKWSTHETWGSWSGWHLGCLGGIAGAGAGVCVGGADCTALRPPCVCVCVAEAGVGQGQGQAEEGISSVARASGLCSCLHCQGGKGTQKMVSSCSSNPRESSSPPPEFGRGSRVVNGFLPV